MHCLSSANQISQLELTLDDIKWAIVGAKKLKIKQEVYSHSSTSSICIHSSFDKSITVIPRKNRLRIYVDNQDKYYRLRELKRGLAEVVVKVSLLSTLDPPRLSPRQGVSTIQRAIINIKDKDDAKGKKGDKELLVEGYGLQKCMIAEGESPK